MSTDVSPSPANSELPKLASCMFKYPTGPYSTSDPLTTFSGINDLRTTISMPWHSCTLLATASPSDVKISSQLAAGY